MVSRGSKSKKDQVPRGRKTKLWRQLHRMRQNKGCGRQAEKFELGWAPGKNDWGCPVENTGYVTTMFRGTSYCYVNNLDFGTYGTSSFWDITFFVGIILYKLSVSFQLDFSLCPISCANLSLFFSTAFSSLSWANFGPKKVYAEPSNICCSNGLKYWVKHVNLSLTGVKVCMKIISRKNTFESLRKRLSPLY